MTKTPPPPSLSGRVQVKMMKTPQATVAAVSAIIVRWYRFQTAGAVRSSAGGELKGLHQSALSKVSSSSLSFNQIRRLDDATAAELMEGRTNHRQRDEGKEEEEKASKSKQTNRRRRSSSTWELAHDDKYNRSQPQHNTVHDVDDDDWIVSRGKRKDTDRQMLLLLFCHPSTRGYVIP